jgi:hypothetical protein
MRPPKVAGARKQRNDKELSRTQVRKAAGWSRDRAAVIAQVSHALTRLYEIDPKFVTDEVKRGRLDEVWKTMRAIAEGRAA